MSGVLYAPKQLSEHPSDPVYWVQRARTVGSVKTAFNMEMSIDFENAQYGPTWWYENMSFMIDRQWISNFTWNAPIKVCETVVEKRSAAAV